MTLTETQRAILEAAAEHPNHLAYPPARLPAAARQAVAKALMKHRLVIGFHQASYDAIAKWTVDGDEMLLKLTDEGLRAIGIDPNARDAAEEDEQSAEAIARRNAERRPTCRAQQQHHHALQRRRHRPHRQAHLRRGGEQPGPEQGEAGEAKGARRGQGDGHGTILQMIASPSATGAAGLSRSSSSRRMAVGIAAAAAERVMKL
jgi:hypothetical protein